MSAPRPRVAPAPVFSEPDPSAAYVLSEADELRLDKLLEMEDELFDKAVERYVTSRNATSAEHAIFRDEQVIERTLEAVERLRTAVNAQLEALRNAPTRGRDAAVERQEITARMEVYAGKVRGARRVLRPLVGELRNRRKAEIAAATSVDREAFTELRRRHLHEFLAIRREIKRKREREAAKLATADGNGKAAG